MLVIKPTDAGIYICNTGVDSVNNSDLRVNLKVILQKYAINSTERKEKDNILHNIETLSKYFSKITKMKAILFKYLFVDKLPFFPQKIQANQTQNGIIINWSYPNHTPVKIKYFQIYFREVKYSLGLDDDNWKSTEPIESNMNSYLISQKALLKDKIYEFIIISFSKYSKSLPSQAIFLKY